jgi:hypothetical protein
MYASTSDAASAAPSTVTVSLPPTARWSTGASPLRTTIG